MNYEISEKQINALRLELDSSIVNDLLSKPVLSPIEALDEMFPYNDVIMSNGDMKGGWELNPKQLFKFEKVIQSTAQYEAEPTPEEIEVVVLLIKHYLRYGKKK